MNLLEEFGYKEKDIEKKINEAWSLLFEDKNSFYHETKDGAYVVDTATKKIGGMETGIAMILAVQMNKKEIFEKLWNFARKHLIFKEGPAKGLLANSCETDGTIAEGTVSNAGTVQWICTALFLAQHRWAFDDPKKSYGKKAISILKKALNKDTGLWNRKSFLPVISDEKELLCISELTPQLYSLFAMFADPKSSTFWSNSAEASRKAIIAATNMETGLYPSIINADGTPNKKQKTFSSLGNHAMINMAIFTMWFGDSPDLAEIAKVQMKFFDKMEISDFKNYRTDGTPAASAQKNPVSLCASIASASLVIERSHSEVKPAVRAMEKRAVKRFWNCPLAKGKESSRENCSYLMTLLVLSGKFMVY